MPLAEAALGVRNECEQDHPLVAVIIPVRDDARRLELCLQSLGRLQYPARRLQVVVVDNGSIDDSASIAAKYGAHVLNRPGLKVGALRNEGVAAVDAEILAFVDSDHEVPIDWVERAVTLFFDNPDVQAVGAPCLAPPNGTWVQRSWERHRLRSLQRGYVRWLGAGNLFVRKSVFDQLGGFRTDFTAAEDVDLCQRICRTHGRILCDPQIVNIHHGEPLTLFEFYRKERWRGSSGIKAYFLSGMPLREAFTLLFPLYHLMMSAIVCASIPLSIWLNSLLPLVASLVLTLLPAFALSITTALKVRRCDSVVPLTVLYFTYALARAVALFR